MAGEKPLPWGLKAKTLAPGSMKNISENKLKAFNIGSMNVIKGTTKKEQEAMRSKREQEEAAEVYKEFVESFEDANKGINRAWVKGGVVNPEKGEDKFDKAGNKIYKPTSKLLEKKSASTPKEPKQKDEEKPERPNKPMPTPQRLWTPTPVESLSQSKKKNMSAADKRKTNLELFKEELKSIQEERQERRKIRQELGIAPSPAEDLSNSGNRKSRFEPSPETIAAGVSIGINPLVPFDDRLGSFTYENDTQTTNLYLGNINPKMTEMQLCEIFGKYGPLASVKVMWPRTEEEKSRGRNCGFVAYMNRKDGERALANLQGKDIMEFEMKLGWGKAVPIPPHPIYIPPALSELTLPPPPSGLPFNAQPIKIIVGSSARPEILGLDGTLPGLISDDPEKSLANAIVKVVIPTERNLLCVIHRMIEFVVREGPMFEAMIMNRELQNPMFRFLFENQSPAHVYYRWKLFSILQGDSPFKWRTEEFFMFKGGSAWRPPQMNPYSQGMPEELVEGSNTYQPMPVEEGPKKGILTDSQRDKLEDILRELTPERTKIGDCMIWCLEHAESAEEIVECIAESLSILQTPIPKKIARLFLISDILHNCSARVPHASFYRRYFEGKLPEIFKDIHESYEKIDARLKAEQFKQKVMACFRAWEDWAVYTSDYLINLQNIFLGLVVTKFPNSPLGTKEDDIDGTVLDDVDGIPFEDLDGVPLDALKGDKEDSNSSSGPVKGIVPYGDDLDGEPIEKEVKVEPSKSKPAFVPSKWETVDESELEAQAMTVSKWDLLDQKQKEKEKQAQADIFEDEDIDGKPLDEMDEDMPEETEDSWQEQEGESTAASQEDARDSDRVEEDKTSAQIRHEISEAKRAKLREIELKVMKYQDELEAGKRSRKSEMSIGEQVNHYRRKLLRKEDEKEREQEYEHRREDDRSRDKERSRTKDRNREVERFQKEDGDDPDGFRHSYREAERSDGRSSSRKQPRDVEYGESRYREKNDGEKIREARSRDPGSDRGYRNVEEREAYYYAEQEQSGSEHGYQVAGQNFHRSRSGSRSEEETSRASSAYVDSNPLVSYGRSPSNSPHSSFLEEESHSSTHKRRHRHRSPKKSSKSNSPRKSKRSRSRSPARHKHKKNKRL